MARKTTSGGKRWIASYHGEVHPSNSKRWCSIHKRWISDSLRGEEKTTDWNNHAMCDVNGTKPKSDEKKKGHALRKPRKSKKSKKGGKRRKGSRVFHYCSEHGRFRGRAWGGHRTTCQLPEVSQREWFKKARTVKMADEITIPNKNGATIPNGDLAFKVGNHLKSLDEKIKAIETQRSAKMAREVELEREMKDLGDLIDRDSKQIKELEENRADFVKEVGSMIEQDTKIVKTYPDKPLGN